MDAKDRDELILDNQGLISFILKKWNCMGDEDLWQIGCIGLIKAADTYIPNDTATFQTYAVCCIASEVGKYFQHFRCESHKTEYYTDSFETPIKKNEFGDAITLGDTLGYTPNMDKSFEYEELYQYLDKLKRKSSPKAFNIFIQYFGLYNNSSMNGHQIAKKYNVSHQCIYDSIRRSMKKLKQIMKV